jgi:hypothetical protein
MPPQDENVWGALLRERQASRRAREVLPTPDENVWGAFLREKRERGRMQERPLGSPDVPRGAVGSFLKGLRAIDQYGALGPALAVQESIQEGTPLTLSSIIESGREASRDDLSFRDLAKRGGMEGWKATALGLAGDIGLSPLNLIAPVKVASMAGRAARLPQAAKAVGLDRALAAAKETSAAKFLGKHFVTDYGKDQQFIDLHDQYLRQAAQSAEETQSLTQRLLKFDAKDREKIKEWAETPDPKGFGIQGRLTSPQRDKILEGSSGGLGTTSSAGENILDVSRDMRDASMRQYTEGKKLGLFPADSALEGTHTMRLYEEIEKGGRSILDPSATREARQLFGLKPRLDFSTTTARKEGVALTPIKDVAPSVAKGQFLTGRLLAGSRFFDKLADEATGIAVDVAGRTDGQLAAAGLKRVPGVVAKEGKKAEGIYGKLSGKAVPEAVYEDVIRVGGEGLPGEWGRMWQKGVGWWKYGKVVANPASHSRNFTGNMILAHMAGLAPWKAHRYAQSVRSLAKKDEFYKLAKEHGTFLTDTFIGSEVPHLLATADNMPQLQRGMQNFFSNLGAGVKKIVKAPAKAYQFEEQFFKQAFFIDQLMKSIRKAGKRSIEDLSSAQKASFSKAASKAAEDALFNYRKLPRIVERIRRWGVVPFITFPTKAAAATVKSLGQRPGVLNQYGNIIRAFEPSIQEQAMERSALPEYMQENWMRLPPNTPFIESENGEPLFMNMEYILPWAELGDIAQRAKTGDWKQGFLGTGGKEPSYLNIPALKIAASVYSGEDAFTGRAVEDYPGGAAMYYFDQFVPPWMGRGGREIVSSFQGEGVDPRRPYMQKRSPGAAVAANLFGLRATPRDITQARLQKYRSLAYQMEEKQREAARIRRRGATTPREIRVMRDDLRTNMDELREIFAKLMELQQGRPPVDGGGAE